MRAYYSAFGNASSASAAAAKRTLPAPVLLGGGGEALLLNCWGGDRLPCIYLSLFTYVFGSCNICVSTPDCSEIVCFGNVFFVFSSLCSLQGFQYAFICMKHIHGGQKMCSLRSNPWTLNEHLLYDSFCESAIYLVVLWNPINTPLSMVSIECYIYNHIINVATSTMCDMITTKLQTFSYSPLEMIFIQNNSSSNLPVGLIHDLTLECFVV